MPRSSQLLHPQREPVAARPAATMLLLRDAPEGLQVLMTRRSSNANFAADAFVFPGGMVDAQDAQCHDIAARRVAQDAALLTQAIAALRETYEELGILLARNRDGTPASADQIAAIGRKLPLAAQCRDAGLVLCADQVFRFVHWTTDRVMSRRFKVPFFVARIPEGQEPVADETEQFEPVWVSPKDALARHHDGKFFMLFPTVRTLERLGRFANVAEVLGAAASEQPLWSSCPRAGLLGGREARYMEHDSAYGELALVCPDGQIQHSLDWQSETPTALLRNVMRLTAPNPGVMTGPGTNSYLVGDPHTGYIAIDPGPNDAEHLQRLWRAAGGDIRMIVCTHSHIDHSPGAKPLQVLCAAESGADKAPKILGLPSAPTARQASTFVPDRALAQHERLVLQGQQIRHTLRVLHTPGHAANHLCLILEEDGLLFSGDHVLNGSTTVVDPPDGDMSAYIDSLDALIHACAATDTQARIEFILPAHGYVLGTAQQTIAQLKAHRLKREAKVIAAMRARPEGGLSEWVALVYDDVPARMWPVAQRSLLAHVQRIEALGLVHIE